MNRTTVLTLFTLAVAATLVFATGSSESAGEDTYRIGVFVPGVVDGSPTYEMMVRGVESAVAEAGTGSVAVVEGGFNQSTWEEGVMSMAASGSYDLIVTSNPSMPEIAATVAEAVPGVRFLVLDGYLSGNDQIHTVLFNQREQAFLSGYFAGLISETGRAGLLAGQEYPIMNEVILPAFELGVQTVSAGSSVDFRVLGNWYDAGKAQEITGDMITQGSDVILTIAGGGNQGTIAAARERGAAVLWYDDSGYDQAPGVVLGSSYVQQDTATYEATLRAIRGELPWGEAEISFDTDHPAFIEHVDPAVRDEMEALLQRLAEGQLNLEMAVPGP